MTVNKRNHLKRMIKLNVLASLCEISPMTLSRIINNHIKPSDDLAQRLADNANKLCASDDYFQPGDFIANRFKNKG